MVTFYKHNYPIETGVQRKFWASKHKSNRLKVIIAYSLSESNANDNMRRQGFNLHLRTRALRTFKGYVNNPSMSGIPFSVISIPWYNELN